MIFNYPTLAAPTSTLTFTNNPESPYEREVIKHNSSVQMEDGSFYVYSRSVTNYRYTISVVLTSETERDALETSTIQRLMEWKKPLVIQTHIVTHIL